jgi:hypothetical protein
MWEVVDVEGRMLRVGSFANTTIFQDISLARKLQKPPRQSK